MSSGARRGVALALALGLALAAHDAAASESDACIDAYEAGQQRRAAGQLVLAKRAFERCAARSCPAVTQPDCATWLAEIDATLPTIVIAVRDADGRDRDDASVDVDGARVADRLDGRAMPVDPGKRRVRVKLGGEERAIELLVREGERGRVVAVNFDAPGGSIEVAADRDRDAVRDDEPADGVTIPVGAWVLGGVGVAGMGVFAVVGGLFVAERKDALLGCAPRCSDDVVDGLRGKALVADVGLGVGLGGLVAGAAWALVAATSADAATSAGAGTSADTTAATGLASQVAVAPWAEPVPGGATLGLAIAF